MNDRYVSAFSLRYASDEMQYLFSEDKKFTTFRLLWIALAKAEKKLGLDITDGQIATLEKYKNDINYEVAKEREAKTRHDVMSHVYAYGEQAKEAKGIIHLGATSCYVGDNTDLIIMKQALELVREKLVCVMRNLCDFAEKYKGMPALAYTHLQPAQLTTVGKRATLWLNELFMDLKELEHRIDNLEFLGCKGTTGTQASFMELFENDTEKVKKLDKLIANEMGFDKIVMVSGQTYSRKVDGLVLNVLSQIAQSAYKFANDLRILASFKEMEEPFEKDQIGSSAMPYKRNPMRCERICSLARYVIVDALNPAITASTQWFERTLDDSANKRISVSEAFLAVDAILNIYINVTKGMVVYPKVIESRIMQEIPFMASENILMSAVKKGKDRQELHERIRVHAMEAAKQVKEFGKKNDLIERIVNDKEFDLSYDEILKTLDPKNFIGRSEEQTSEFVDEVRSYLKKYELVNFDSELKV